MPDDEEDGGDEILMPGSRADIVRTAREIADEYAAKDLQMTVRQMYYQFVSRGFLPSGQRVYKRIVAALAEARLRGEFPMDLIIDAERDAQPGNFTEHEDDVTKCLRDVGHAIFRLPITYARYDRWWGQKTFVSVWVEKVALAGVFEQPCRQLGVGLFACKGYPSVSALYQWLKHLENATSQKIEIDDRGTRRSGRAERAVILYFGDHDPDGWEIPRSAMRNLRTLMRATDEDDVPLVSVPDHIVDDHPEVDSGLQLIRVALNMPQIHQYKPPPFEAKVTSSRYASYIDEHHTHNAWELDALDPAVLRSLITTSVQGYWDPAIYKANQDTIEARRADLRKRMLRAGWFRKALVGEE